MDPVIVWTIVAAAFVVLELVTVAFVALYVALGAVAAAIVAGAGGDTQWQYVAFALATVVPLVLTRPWLRDHLTGPTTRTNVHTVAGSTGVVSIAIDNHAGTGQIRIGTEFWTARRTGDLEAEVIQPGEKVYVVEVVGVTAHVQPADAPRPDAVVLPEH